MIAVLGGHRVETITYDNRPEFSGHWEVGETLECAGYFCKPYHSWEKGAVENYNGLVRQYAPTGTDFIAQGVKRIKHIERELNSRPRKCLDFLPPL